MADVTVTEVVEVVTVSESVVAVTVTDSGSPGTPGPAIELQTSATHIQWKVAGAASWINLVALADLEGPAGPSIEMQTTSTHIQYRVVGGSSWADIIALSELTGEAGLAATISVGSVTTGAPGSSASVTNTGSSSAAVFFLQWNSMLYARHDYSAAGNRRAIADQRRHGIAPDTGFDKLEDADKPMECSLCGYRKQCSGKPICFS